LEENLMRNEIPKRPWFGWFKVWRLNRAIDYQSDLIEADARYEVLKTSFEHLVKERKLTAQYSADTLQHNIDTLQRLNALETLAEDMGMSLPTYEEYQRAEIHLFEKAGEATIEVDKTRRLDELKLKFKELSDKMDLDKERESFRIQLEAALAYKYLDIEAAMRTVERLSILHERRYQIQFSGSPRGVMLEQLSDIDILITGARHALKGLVQVDQQEDLEGSTADTFSRGLPSPDLREREQQDPLT
jgi:hypothetical protein